MQQVILIRHGIRNNIIILILSILYATSLSAQDKNICEKIRNINSTLQKHHISPPALDDNFSSMVYDRFLEEIDPYGMIFTASQLILFDDHKHSIDNQIISQDCSVVDDLTNVYIENLEEIKSRISQLTYDNFEFNDTDSLILSKGQYTTQEHIISNWKKSMKLQVFKHLVRTDESITDINEIDKNSLHHAIDAVRSIETCRINSKIENRQLAFDRISNKFIMALTFSYDPHTVFFSTAEKEQFTAGLQKEALSFGFGILENAHGEYEVIDIIPGGPAWASNSFEEKDILKAIEKADGSILQANCLSIDEIVKYLESANTKKVKFIIQKRLGEEVEATISKDLENVAENIIHSYILQGDRKIAYISLPSFYTEVDDQYYVPNGCANDVAKEIIQLQREAIDGIIIDLRFNGGGAILEAIRLSGMFVNSGALAISEYKDEGLATIKDIDRGTLYSGPLILMVNSFSASASELFASAMQDHNRAVIVGTRTFGKGTIQSVIPVEPEEDTDNQTSDIPGDGFLKLTVGRYYRITGKSVQKKGVVPDVYIPDFYENMNISEEAYTSSLPESSVDKKTYYRPLKELPLTFLQNQSKKRIFNNSLFKFPVGMNEYFNSNNSTFTLPLNLDYFLNNLSDKETTPLANIAIDDLYSIQLPEFKIPYEDVLVRGVNSTDKTMKDLMNDIQLMESYRVMQDLIKQKDKSKL